VDNEDRFDIETLLGELTAQLKRLNWLIDDNGLESLGLISKDLPKGWEPARQQIQGLIQHIQKQIHATYKSNPDEGEIGRSRLRLLWEPVLYQIAGAYKAYPLVVTTNWDGLFEDYLKESRLVPVTGIDPQTQLFHDYQYDRELQENEVLVLHLHGHAHWFSDKHERIAYQPIPTPEALTPVIYYPTPDKSEARHPELLKIGDAFERALRGARLVVVVGYSARDDHIVDAFRRVAKSRGENTLRVAVLDRCPGVAAARLGNNREIEASPYRTNLGGYDFSEAYRNLEKAISWERTDGHMFQMGPDCPFRPSDGTSDAA